MLPAMVATSTNFIFTGWVARFEMDGTLDTTYSASGSSRQDVSSFGCDGMVTIKGGELVMVSAQRPATSLLATFAVLARREPGSIRCLRQTTAVQDNPGMVSRPAS